MTMDNAWWSSPCALLQTAIAEQAEQRQAELTKPLGALGRLEHVAIQFAAWQGQVQPVIKQPEAVLFAGDHGVVAQGVSAFPQAVTVEMLKNFVHGGAAMSVLTQHHGMPLTIVNCGTAIPCEQVTGVLHRPIGLGTADFSQQPAMTTEHARQALALGAEQAERAHQQGCDLLIVGEMGIGNTSCASALAAVLLQQPVAHLVGAGTGLAGAALAHKCEVLTCSVARASIGQHHDALSIAEQLGGFEVLAMTGAYLRAAQLGLPSLVDGFIASAALLLAQRFNAQVTDWVVYGHHSAEPGHQAVLSALDAQPLVSLGMRLGEGSGAAIAYPLMQQALLLHRSMATFAEAAVSNGSSED